MSNNLDILLSSVDALIKKRHLRISSKEYSEKFFGNAFVTLESDVIKIMLVYDRGQLFANIAASSADSSNTKDYFDLVTILNQIPSALRKNNSVWDMGM